MSGRKATTTMNNAEINTEWMHDPLWYKDAIIYELHVKAFFDSDNNGTGDFLGLIQKLDYIQELGVNTLWLLPFYPSPMLDDGYDISDYHTVHPTFGTLADFRQLVRSAHKRGIKIITELVLNHTSNQHPWFQAARRSPAGSSKRNYYLWSNSDQKFPQTRIIFTNTEKSNWAWDEEAKAYYWHRFFSHQPDLNYNNPQVVRAVIRIMRFWLDQGVDGVRLDAIPYLCVREGTSNENLPETHAVIKKMRAVVDEHYQNRVFLAEANQWPEDVRDYFGEGDECHMAYHFPLMPRMYMAIAQEDRHPIVEIMRQTPDIPDSCQWCIFLRNHDELTLEMVTNKERDYMYRMYALDSRARLNVGIRRRLAPLLDNELDKILLMNSLLLSITGSPIIYYGDEIGMGDNLYLGDRNGVRTPMQWSPDRNAGFSRAYPQSLYLPPIMDPVFGYEAVNVEAQLLKRSSLLNWMQRVLAVRKNHHAFGRGKLVFLNPGNRKILAYLKIYQDDIILCVANLSRAAQPVELDLVDYKGHVPVELMGRSSFPPIGDLPYLLTLPGYGFYWFRMAGGADVPVEHLRALELPMLVLFDGWNSFFHDRVMLWRTTMADNVRAQLEKDVLPSFLATQRWYGAKGEMLQSVSIKDYAEWETKDDKWLMALIDIQLAVGEPLTCFIPLALAWETGDKERFNLLSATAMADVRHHAQVGVLGDAFADPMFCRAIVQAIGSGQILPCQHGNICFKPTAAYHQVINDEITKLPVHPCSMQGSNTSVLLNEKLFLKGYRHLQIGIQPEYEIGRFLTEVARFANSAPVAGAVEYETSDGGSMTLALLQGFVENQGDCWSYTQEYLSRHLEQCRMTTEPVLSAEQVHAAYLMLMQTLGQRTAELHHAFAITSGNAAFDPEPVTSADIVAWKTHVQKDAIQTLDLLELWQDKLPENVRKLSEMLLAQRSVMENRIQECVPESVNAIKTRYHGDFHLGQVLLVQNDCVFTDFEGEPTRPLAERCQKHSALRDVAGMLRSFSYAAFSALAHACSERPDDFDRLDPVMHIWETETGRVFLSAYNETACNFGMLATPEANQGLLDLFMLEKALYEVHYEIEHRPDWTAIPLRGILGLLANLND